MGSAVVSVFLAVPAAVADPLPGYDLDPAVLEQRMTACMEYRVPEQETLMGWVSFRDGAQRYWRCSSLRHMMLDRDDREGGNIHNPYVNVADFMRCADEVVTHGFPRPGNRPGNIKLIKQYNGTASRGIAVINESTGDVATIYTEPRDDDWTACANAL